MPNINLLDFNEKAANKLDERFVHDSVSAILAANPSDFNFVDARTVLLDEENMSGLADYSRDNGFVQGTIAQVKRPYTLSMDRGRSFTIDSVDAEDATIKGADKMRRFQKEHVAPEVDAFTIAKLFSYAKANGHVDGAKITADNVFAKFLELQNALQDTVGYGEDIICFVSAGASALLQQSDKFARNVNVADFKRGEVFTKVKAIDTTPLLPVSNRLMKSEYQFLNGIDAAQKNGGFLPTDDAEQIGFILMSRKAAAQITKCKKIRTFTPETNQRADAWQFDYRRFYDVLASKEKSRGIFAVTM